MIFIVLIVVFFSLVIYSLAKVAGDSDTILGYKEDTGLGKK